MAECLKQGPVVLATVVRVKGSVPREVGAKMVVCSDSRIVGTIGGGAGEAKVIRQALKVLETGEKQFVTIDLSGVPQRETQGVCGGMMHVWLERWQGETALTLVNQIIEQLKSGKRGTLITPLEPGRSPYLELLTPDTIQPPSSLIPYPSSFTLHPSSFTLHPSSFTLHPSSFHLPLLPPPTLLIVGGGHVAVPLAHIAHLSGFRVVVQDDRPEFANSQRFPDAAMILAMPIVDAMNSISDISELYATLVTRGYVYDLEALRRLVQYPTKYVGMIGSEKRVKTVLQALRENVPSVDTHAAFSQFIHAPIGLDIGALTPEEIAVSICAELIQVRRGGTGLPLSKNLREAESISPVANQNTHRWQSAQQVTQQQ